MVSTRLGSWYEGGVGSAGRGSMGLVGRSVTLVPITLDVSRDVLGEYMVGELVTVIALCADARAGCTLSSGASRLFVSPIGRGVREGGRFGAFRFYLPLRLVGPSLLGAADLGAREL